MDGRREGTVREGARKGCSGEKGRREREAIWHFRWNFGFGKQSRGRKMAESGVRRKQGKEPSDFSGKQEKSRRKGTISQAVQ